MTLCKTVPVCAKRCRALSVIPISPYFRLTLFHPLRPWFSHLLRGPYSLLCHPHRDPYPLVKSVRTCSLTPFFLFTLSSFPPYSLLSLLILSAHCLFWTLSATARKIGFACCASAAASHRVLILFGLLPSVTLSKCTGTLVWLHCFSSGGSTSLSKFVC